MTKHNDTGQRTGSPDAGTEHFSGRTGTPSPIAVGATEAARRLGIGTRTLWTLTRSGQLRAARVGRRVLYPLDELQRFIRNRQDVGTPDAGQKGRAS